jgi:hypothetical protein
MAAMKGRDLALYVRMTPAEVTSVLKLQAQPERPLAILVGDLGQRGFVGRVGHDRFRIRAASAFSPFYHLHLFGDVRDYPGGAALYAVIRRQRAATLLLWAQALIGSGLVLAAIYSTTLNPDFAPSVVFGIALVLVLLLARRTGQDDRQQLQDFVLGAFPPAVRLDGNGSEPSGSQAGVFDP